MVTYALSFLLLNTPLIYFAGNNVPLDTEPETALLFPSTIPTVTVSVLEPCILNERIQCHAALSVGDFVVSVFIQTNPSLPAFGRAPLP